MENVAKRIKNKAPRSGALYHIGFEALLLSFLLSSPCHVVHDRGCDED